MINERKEINVEIWSDIMCPFCYLGKHRFEKALSQFEEKDKVSVVWKSFQLNPSIITDPSVSINEYLSRSKGITAEQAGEMNEGIAAAGRILGLEYNFGKVRVANTFRAHLLLHFAKKHGKQDEVKERLFIAYFTEGKNVDDTDVLAGVAAQAGLDAIKAYEAVTGEEFVDEVREDFYEARQMEINSVPFFIFNRRYGINGAQDPAVFLNVLHKSINQ